MKEDRCALCHVPFARDLETAAVVCVACDARVEKATQQPRCILRFKPQKAERSRA